MNYDPFISILETNHKAQQRVSILTTKEILDQQSVSQLARGYQRRDIDYWKSLVGVCEIKSISNEIVHYENFELKFDAGHIYNRLNYFTTNRVHSERIREFEKDKPKSTEDICSICLDFFKINEEFPKVPCCAKLFHEPCLKKVFQNGFKCAGCRAILS